ncbi:MAG: putative methyltransferase [Candidatus Hydrogenedentes bacterium ADurb.Bin179]|nr:MAG: putative methyltransferase [Candidatus Hydrogenedentes bacterium ADurb.Bin179]
MMVKMVTILIGDCLDVLKTLPDCSVHCCVTSPPYWGLRDYGVEGQFGMERTPEEYVAKMTAVFHEVWRVLRDDGTLWLNLGDSYFSDTKGSRGPSAKQDSNAGSRYGNRHFERTNGLKPKDLIGIPWRVAFALQADGWYLRQDIIWSKPNPMPESVRDRCTKAHEYVFLLSKSSRYYYDAEAVKEESVYPDDNRKERQKPEDYAAMMGDSGQLRAVINPSNARTYPYRNRRSVWTITPKPYRGAHFAVMPPDLAELCILAGTSKRGCCPACGKPWERVVDKANPKGRRDRGGPNDGPRDAGIWSGRAGTREYTTVGWQPGCKCSAGLPVPCTVLDPFGGSGTTGYIASRNGCRAVMIELNPKYAKLAHDRCG